ncbi:hypothetical protein [Bacillus sp. SA1-12]|nr:hypothetical protein [Bacillus sp. SA1-12]
MTKKFNKGSKNQNSPENGSYQMEIAQDHLPGDNSKGNKRNKVKKDKSN